MVGNIIKIAAKIDSSITLGKTHLFIYDGGVFVTLSCIVNLVDARGRHNEDKFLNVGIDVYEFETIHAPKAKNKPKYAVRLYDFIAYKEKEERERKKAEQLKLIDVDACPPKSESARITSLEEKLNSYDEKFNSYDEKFNRILSMLESTAESSAHGV